MDPLFVRDYKSLSVGLKDQAKLKINIFNSWYAFSINNQDMYKANKLIDPKEYFPKVNRYVKPIIDEWIDKHSLKEDIELHHYTTPKGIRGIIEDREVWSTEIESMNDTKEIQYGINVIKDEINNAKERHKGNSLVEDVFLSSVEDEVDDLAREEYNIFVTCFCEEGDLLSQWRGYADRGGGYSIKFKFNQNTRIIDEESNLKTPNLRKVIYDKEKQGEIAGNLLEAVCSICNTFPSLERDNPNKKEMWSSVAKYVSKILIDFAISFKHGGFKEEKEWRLVRVIEREKVNENVANFRTSGGLVVTYVNTGLTEIKDEDANIFPVVGSVLGPSHNDERAKRSLELFVDSVARKDPIINIEDFNIESPDVPFKPSSK